jgi:uncharacterized delta-60 repeat protein
VLLAVSAAAALAVPLLASAAGELDPSFGTGGKVLTDFGASDVVNDVLVQPDGKIFAAGITQDLRLGATRFALTRYAGDGSLDLSFGSGGTVTTSFGGDENRAEAAILQGDGKIVVAGAASGGSAIGTDIAMARYNGDGTLDADFGTGGKVLTDFGSTHDHAFGVARQPDGKFVVAGTTRAFGPPSMNPQDFALARYNPNGTLDTSFGVDGQVTTDFASNSSDIGFDVALAPDGKIVAVGLRNAEDHGDVAVARYLPDGSLDPSFDSDGKVITAFAPSAIGYTVLVLPDGRIVVAGAAGADLALFRYTVSGGLDPSFGSGGIASASFAPRFSGAEDLALQADGKLVASGSAVQARSQAPGDFAIALARFDGSGKLDPSFYDDGVVSTDFAPARWDEARTLALQADGKIIAAGFSAPLQNGVPVGADFALARYLPSLLLEVTRGGPGSGSVTSSPAGISCGDDCSNGYAAGTTVTLTAAPNAGSFFEGWSGGCSGRASSCTVTVRAATSVTATFAGCEVPAVKGKRLPVARRRIVAGHCLVGKIRFKHSKRKKGLVIAQTPSAGAELPFGARVNLVVSRGPKPKPR